MTDRIFRFLAEQRPDSPCLVVDLDAVASSYQEFVALLPRVEVFYAVKANPAPALLARLAALGACFDVASPAELDLCLATGTPPDRISYGNTIKKQRDIAYAYRRGVRLFAFDSEAELAKLAAAAPGASVFCRLLTAGRGAEWPLSRKFGCSPAMAVDLMLRARDAGLDARGLSFHVGSQQTDPARWDSVLAVVARVFRRLRRSGLALRMVNLGGGFPATYRRPVPGRPAYAEAIETALARHFEQRPGQVIAEPGRGLVGNAGVIEAEVVLVSRKDYDSPRRWVYLDVGRFGGLAETMGEAIRYPVRTPRDGGPAGPVVLAGPTCDSADILYQKAGYELPLDLAVGDRVQLLGTGAYTASYASVGFNGFPPLAVHCI